MEPSNEIVETSAVIVRSEDSVALAGRSVSETKIRESPRYEAHNLSLVFAAVDFDVNTLVRG